MYAEEQGENCLNFCLQILFVPSPQKKQNQKES